MPITAMAHKIRQATTNMIPRGHMATISQGSNEKRPYHDLWQDNSRSVSCPTNSSMVRTIDSFITKRYDGLFQTIYIYVHHFGWDAPDDILVHPDETSYMVNCDHIYDQINVW